MCSNDDGGLRTMRHTEESVAEPNILCKCGQTAEFKLDFRETECHNCFLSHVRHKFRATLGSSKVLPKDAQVLCIFDGSENAACLLDMLDNAQNQNHFKRLNCFTKVLHIDCYVLNQPIDIVQYRNYLSELRTFMERFKHFECYIKSIGDIENSPLNIKNFENYLERDRSAEEKFLKQILSIRSQTSFNDYLKHHRSKIIASAATALNCHYALVSDISTTLASTLLTAVALGRGGNAALDVSIVDNRLGNGIKLLRPLKDLSSQEVKMYVKARELDHPQFFEQCQGARTSLQTLTTQFVQTLQQNYSSTVSTVFRMGDKIAPKRNIGNLNVTESTNCSFCNSPLDTECSTTLLATEFSHLVSIAGTSNEMAQNFVTNQNKSNSNVISLCYACRNIQEDCDPATFLFQ